MRQEAQVGRANSECNQTPSAQRDKPPTIRNDQTERAYSEGQSQQGDEGNDATPDDQYDEHAGDGIKRCYATIFRPKRNAYLDQTGKFVCQSTAKNKYVHIFYKYTSNYIFAEPIQSTSDKDITEAFEKCMQTLKKTGITPELHLIDNQCGKLQVAALEK
jgi:hypothetical protein